VVQVAELSSVPVEVASSAGGPRDPTPPVSVRGPWSPVALLCTLPEHPAVPAVQLSVADAFDQLDAPGTVWATFAPAPGEPAGGVAGCCAPPPPPEPSPELPVPYPGDAVGRAEPVVGLPAWPLL
jgi:hypothetical protein